VHVAASVGWLGAVVAYLGLVWAGLDSSDPQAVRSAWWGLDQLTRVLAPLSVAALVSGVVQGLITPWGLVWHYWVMVKLGHGDHRAALDPAGGAGLGAVGGR
jgi:hypothetical protein